MNPTTNPTGAAALISTTVKAVLIAFIATGVLPWGDTEVSAVALAVAALVDLGIFLGLIRPRVTPTANPKTNDGTPLVPAAVTRRDDWHDMTDLFG